MFKLISILITNGIVLFMLISCHNKTSNSRNTINLEYENNADSLNSYKMDISHFIHSIEPGETIVEEKQMQGKELITRKNQIYQDVLEKLNLRGIFDLTFDQLFITRLLFKRRILEY